MNGAVDILDSETLGTSKPEAMGGRCGAGPCGYHYATGGECSGTCERLVDDQGNHTMGGPGHTCQFGHGF